MAGRYADIVLPLACDPFTFAVPDELIGAVSEGVCVGVQIGNRKRYAGIVWRLHDRRPTCSTVREVERILLSDPLVPALQRRLWEWVADYYLCTLGEVMRAALPAALKPEGFSPEALAAANYRPRRVRYAGLGSAVGTLQALNERLETLRRARRQYAALTELCASLPEEELFSSLVPCGRFDVPPAMWRALVQKGLVRIEEREEAAPDPAAQPCSIPEPSPAQREALEIVDRAVQPVSLLYGVAGSGKSEVYAALAARVLQTGGSVLWLLPEIALSDQIVLRVREWFGERVVLYHSRLTDRQRAAVYHALSRNDGGRLVLGTRSALFLPLERLALVVVDEEHDAGYKQSEPVPRYNARDCATVLARLAGARCVLGSATPSLESYFNALKGKYALAFLGERWGGTPVPTVVVSDTLRAVRRGERRTHFNFDLLDRLRDVLAAGRQAILFQNRRGFSPWIACGTCGWVPRCPQCSVTLTLHRSEGRLRCHYCGYGEPAPRRCPRCDAPDPAPVGFGTEKVEQELGALLPGVRIARLDRDTTRRAGNAARILGDFAAGRIDVLVGTQMVTKGFDFSRVGLVGVLNADNLLAYPDFRTAERAFQVMTQVIGRAGRHDGPGVAVIQTGMPADPVIEAVRTGDYPSLAARLLAERRVFFYPPYGRLIGLTLHCLDIDILREAAVALAACLRPIFGARLLGPEAPPVERVRGVWLMGLLLKIETGSSFVEAKAILRDELARFAADRRWRKVMIVLDVDPQ